MDHDAAKHLERHLLNRGWRVVEKEVSESGRENERWHVESAWSPQGAKFILEYLLDPYPGRPAQIWAIEAYRSGDVSAAASPADRLVLSLGGGWMDRCEEFVRSIDCFRADASK